jgi:sigma-B regulation protein RsbU (phosphoserine phosphatase)
VKSKQDLCLLKTAHLPFASTGSGTTARSPLRSPALGLAGRLPQRRVVRDHDRASPGETLLAYTDGVTDAIGADGERFGPSRLAAALLDARGQPVTGIVETLVAELQKFQVGAHFDDTALLALRRLPPTTS